MPQHPRSPRRRPRLGDTCAYRSREGGRGGGGSSPRDAGEQASVSKRADSRGQGAGGIRTLRLVPVKKMNRRELFACLRARVSGGTKRNTIYTTPSGRIHI